MLQKEVHLLCSSGGVRCYSYIGAYKALLRAGYTVSGVSASSMGSVIGLLFCMGLSPQQVEEKILKYPIKKYVKKRYWVKAYGIWLYPHAMYHHPDYATLLKDFTGSDPELKDLPIPYSTLALDLNKQELLSINRDTHPGWKASELLSVATAIPPMFAPVTVDNMLLIDGGIASESPAWVAAAESENRTVVIFKTSAGLPGGNKKGFSRFMGSMIQSAAAATDAFSIQQMPASVLVDIPCGDQQAEEFTITNERIKELILAGEKAMEQMLALCQGDLRKFIKVENIAPVDKKDGGFDMARERNIKLLQKFRQQTSGRHQVFISYSHKDQLWFDKLQLMLAPVEAFHGIKVWDDKEIMPGDLWNDAIKNALSQTRVAICLVSSNFLNSGYISTNELKYFMEEAARQQVRIFPVPVSRLKEGEENPLKDIQFVNSMEPIDELTDDKQHEVLSVMIDQLIEIMRKEDG